MEHRSNFSLREHFRKTILPHIVMKDGYYRLSKEDVNKFQAAFEEYEGRTKRGRKRIQADGSTELTNLNKCRVLLLH